MKLRIAVRSAPCGSGRATSIATICSGAMSALGQKQTFRRVQGISALPPKADIAERDWDVRFVPKAEIL
jgi:hypothetical protein